MTATVVSQIGVEALDDPATDPQLVVRMLRDIARANRWFGGTATVRAGLDLLLDANDRQRTLSLFDVGTGAGDLPLAAVRYAAQRGVTLRPLGLERIPAAARLACSAGVPTLLGCASALPIGDRSVDIVLVSQVAHHLDDDAIVRLFGECSRVARRGVIIADLRPSRLTEIAFRTVGGVLAFHPVTVTDGVTSLRRGFTPTRLRLLTTRAQTPRPTVRWRPFARILACWRTDQ
ncbi:MAG: methyltransferase domain-containing protein [Gemmatimonadales bacterium]